ncbi:polymer-forming cytoskeletal protein [Paenibacillus motobuensis]|uniref:polymer-forming cytoskeletal protein n=1 Tax=Paenibacillus TaxID=44249 RepID=UPI00203E2AF5|nr:MULTISPECIES: polymer-forming cytoskeletal protein [Paenibacillus]MCM3041720.1 polymer-forming cytoskeletal protein [Paenibacillus lutimineralis]MCM3648824.1 polymer-forming cytoskeletal protein [Paenibacillus motobuensis]
MSWLEAEYPWETMNIPWVAGATEWLPLGEFYIDTREKINDVWTHTCYDKLITADVAYISQLSYPTSQKAVFDEICNRLGFVYDSSVVINPSYQIQAGPAGYTCRQVLAYIAGANSASIFMGKDGAMRFKRFSAGAPAVFEMTTADYIRVKQTNPVKTFTRIVVTYNTEDQLTFEAGSGDENQTLYLENPFMTQAQTNALLVALKGLSYLPLTMDSRGYPHLDQGDVIGFEQREGGSWIDTNIPWQDMHIPWDGIQRYTSFILRQTYSFKGGLTHKIEAPSQSEQQSEFPQEGFLSQQVNKLNKENVKFGRSYYGITHSRTEGIVVEREDHKSKLTLNSDKMDWQVNGQSSLYYDAQANRLRFTGHLDAATGTFSGDLKAAGGTFTGTLQGVDGTFSGSLQAATGTFSGNLSAAGGTFKGNLSAAGGTFTGTLIGVDGTFSGTITASTIIGSEIMTSYGGYPRAEMSSSNRMFSVWASSGRGIQMGAYRSGGSYLSFIDGGYEATMSYSASSGLQILAGVGQDIEISARDIDLSASRYINIYDWSDLRNYYNESLQNVLDEKAGVSQAGYNLTFDSTTRNLKMYSRNGLLLAQVNIPK